MRFNTSILRRITLGRRNAFFGVTFGDLIECSGDLLITCIKVLFVLNIDLFNHNLFIYLVCYSVCYSQYYHVSFIVFLTSDVRTTEKKLQKLQIYGKMVSIINKMSD